MTDHSKKWHQRVYLTSSWRCALCDESDVVYRSAEALYGHLSQVHQHMFPPERLHAIARQSIMERPRAPNECLLCCYPVKDSELDTHKELSKRQKRRIQHGSSKTTRITLAMRHPSPHRGVDADTEDSDRSVTASQAKTNADSAEMMARHVAGHLQGLMLLTMRLASLQNSQTDQGDDSKSDSVNIGNSDDIPAAKQLGTPGSNRVSDDIEMRDVDATSEDDDGLLANMILEDAPIPDAEVDFHDLGVKRESDNLLPEQDNFLQKLIQSGAFREPESGFGPINTEFYMAPGKIGAARPKGCPANLPRTTRNTTDTVRDHPLLP